MTPAEWGWMAGLAAVLVAFAVSLTSIPERFLEWRRRIKRELWEADSNGETVEERPLPRSHQPPTP